MGQPTTTCSSPEVKWFLHYAHFHRNCLQCSTQRLLSDES